ncbi:MAG: hypothetical protein IPJ34_02975 [Myxococcales bacterium]|nr:hypothetical protein [Myxococcales bacterium]
MVLVEPHVRDQVVVEHHEPAHELRVAHDLSRRGLDLDVVDVLELSALGGLQQHAPHVTQS